MTNDIHFDNVERKVYPRTFLNTVFVVFNYDIGMEPADLISRIKQFVLDGFNLKIDLTEEELVNGFSIDNPVAGFSYYFSKGNIGVKYMKLDYVSFTETMPPLIYRLITYVRTVLDINMLDDIQIRKVNVLNVREQNDLPIDKDRLVKDVLSQDLLTVSEPAKEFFGLHEAREFCGQTEDKEFVIHYGVQEGTAPEGFKYCGLVLDETVVKKKVALQDVDDKLKEVNEKLFDIFHWSVSSNLLALMNQEK